MLDIKFNSINFRWSDFDMIVDQEKNEEEQKEKRKILRTYMICEDTNLIHLWIQKLA